MIAIRVIQYLISIYIMMIGVRIIASWFPSSQRYHWYYWLSRYTDPYLNLFRRFIPPIGGVLDLSPLLAYLSLKSVEWLILKIIL